ncbi:tetratricopeptide repeat protein [Luteimonas sp. RIT-PG2_3]
MSSAGTPVTGKPATSAPAVKPMAVTVPGAMLVPKPDHVMTIPPALRQQLFAAIPDRGNQQAALEQLMQFLFRPEWLGMQYQPDATYTVEQAFQTRKANCLTFTLLTIALARELGLDAYAQRVDDALTWQQENDVVLRSGHVNAGLRVAARRFTVDVASDSVIAFRPPRRIADDALLSMYYNNRAMELLIDRQAATALPFVSQALQLAPGNASLWSNAGVLYLQATRPDEAERAYLHALQLDPMQADAMQNLARLYRRNGDLLQAQRLERRARKALAQDPFHQFVLAHNAEARGDYHEAMRRYRRAIRLHPDEHRFYFGLARAWLHLGKPQRADAALVDAQRTSEGEASARYHAKLELLRRQFH